MNSKDIWCTLGPSSLNDHVIGRLEDLGVGLLRLNLSHTIVSELPKTLEYIKSRTDVPICLDTEGAQVRTFNGTNLDLRENCSLRIKHRFDADDPGRTHPYRVRLRASDGAGRRRLRRSPPVGPP